jgi:hypothetical protein
MYRSTDPQQARRQFVSLFSEGAAAVVVAVAVCVDVARAEALHAQVGCASRKPPAWKATAEFTAAASIVTDKQNSETASIVHCSSSSSPARRPPTVSASLPAGLHVAEDWCRR